MFCRKAGSGGGAGGNGSIGAPPSCTSPKHDEVTGLTSCAEGYHYRSQPVACEKRQGEDPNGDGDELGSAGQGFGGASSGGAGQGGAGTPIDSGSGGATDIVPPTCFPACAAGEFCRVVSATPYATACSKGCLNDDECGEHQLCACDALRGGVCVEADCRQDSDCSAGYHCAQAEGCYTSGGKFLCQSPEDECVTRADCDDVMCGAIGDHRRCFDGISCG